MTTTLTTSHTSVSSITSTSIGSRDGEAHVLITRASLVWIVFGRNLDLLYDARGGIGGGSNHRVVVVVVDL